MLVSLQWLVLFFFLIIVSILFLIYEVQAKFKWKEEANELQKEIEKLKKNSSNNAVLIDKYNNALKKLQDKLTKRQFEVFMYTVDGLSSKDIAEKIHISSSTVDWHIKDIKEILGIKKRTQFAATFLSYLNEALQQDENKQSKTD